jgi:peptide/nickel transport system ATP-binding protein
MEETKCLKPSWGHRDAALLPLRRTADQPAARAAPDECRVQAKELIGETLRVVGLQPEEILGRFPHQLSGGQRQRV